jgi:putative resolvase
MKAKEVLQILKVTRPTLTSYVKSGKIRIHKINEKHYVYNDEDVYGLIGLKKKTRYKKTNVTYSRVSTSAQKNQLKEQTFRLYDWCTSKGISFSKQYEDVGSGMNFNRKDFNSLLLEVISGKIDCIIIENRDRLVRFGFELLENLFKYFKTTIIVVNDEIQNKTYENELTEDLIAIIHHFSMKMHSHRRKLNKFKKELIDS